jgi:MscS family membrane protein
LLLFFSCLITVRVFGQNATPYDCIYNHLYYLGSEEFDTQLSSRSFSSTDSTEGAEYALKLKQVLDGKGLYVIMEDIPDSPEYYDSILRDHQYYLFPEQLPNIYVKRKEGKWTYPRSIFPEIDRLHSEIYPLGSNFLIKLFPKMSGETWAGLYLWQWFGLGLLFLLILLAYFITVFIIKRLISLLGQSSFWLLQKNAKLLQRISVLLGAFLSLRLFVLLYPALLLSPKLSWLITVGIKTIGALLILLIILRVIDVLYSYFLEASLKTTSKMDEQLLPVVRRGVQVVLISFWLIYLLSLMQVDVTALLAGISIGGVAIALAAQDTIKNLFGSFTIFMDKPFQIGDWIQFGSVEGTVEEVGFRSTRVRSFENSLMSVPNAKLLDTSVNNYGLRRYRRFKTTISITYDTPPDNIERFTSGLRKIVALHPMTRKDGVEIHLNNMSASSLDILFYMFFDVATWTEELAARQEILLAILRLAAHLGINFAFPSISVYQEKGSTTMENDLESFLEDYKSRVQRTIS